MEEGTLRLASLALEGSGRGALRKVSATLGGEALTASLRQEQGRRIIAFENELHVAPGRALAVSLKA